MMRILGIDIGLATTGWAIVEKKSGNINNLKLIDCGAILTKKTLSLPSRLAEIFEATTQIIEKYKPSSVAIEDIFFFKNAKTVIKVSEARGVVLLAANLKGLPVFDYTPPQVKTAVTGYGRAEKPQVQKMIKLIFKLEEVPKPDDVADAVAVAVCHSNSY